MGEGDKAREALMVQRKENEENGRTHIAKTADQFIDGYNKWHCLSEAFMATGENRRADFYIHIGLADTD